MDEDGRTGERRHADREGARTDRRVLLEQRPEPMDRRVEQAGSEPHTADSPRQDADPADIRAAGRKERAQTRRGEDGRGCLASHGHAPARFYGEA